MLKVNQIATVYIYLQFSLEDPEQVYTFKTLLEFEQAFSFS